MINHETVFKKEEKGHHVKVDRCNDGIDDSDFYYAIFLNNILVGNVIYSHRRASIFAKNIMTACLNPLEM